jgi:outer membrane protein OmpA-like peptidoglycan-associated protein
MAWFFTPLPVINYVVSTLIQKLKNSIMAELDVKPKDHKTAWWLWLLIALIALAVLFYFVRGCNATDDRTGTATGTDTSTTAITDNTRVDSRDWNDIDFNAPGASYEEITDKNINVRGNDNYAIYGLGENVLFDTDKSSIRNDAEENLKQIASSLSKRFNEGEIRIFGYTDAEGSAGYNKKLAEERAESVRNWLVKNGNVTENKISVHPVGEAKPVASNTTEQGRQENRRVEIVARRAK